MKATASVHPLSQATSPKRFDLADIKRTLNFRFSHLTSGYFEIRALNFKHPHNTASGIYATSEIEKAARDAASLSGIAKGVSVANC